MRTFVGHESDVNCVAFTRSGAPGFGSASSDCTCKLYDMRAFDALQTYGGGFEEALSIDFSSSDRYAFAAFGDGTVRVWDTLSGRTVGDALTHEYRVPCLQVAPDGRALATGCWDTTATVYA